ncbi:potassium/proton antiporter [Ohtaekwangia koreensis]|uniref:Potassium/proton antiporter, CPA1 family n=1 Tax=Ohtaekwangia koreensis TaxID=688867 RepID=A0A1T5K3A5_9BACT|nr:potassium/proton antiporter [Ohtaekwangia koreensis]SKC58252.1 potassium/proton antiporter, CPA1 family [Ohtaekwangia koreensis]
MLLSSHNILLLGSLLLFVSIISSKTSFRFGIPALILFLIVGMVAGSDGLGGIYFNDPKVAEFLGVVALTFILFSGGLDTKWESVKPVLKSGISLSTIGVLITAAVVGIFSSYFLNISLKEGLLLGAIVSSTDAAAVFSILRSRNIGLKGNIRPLLELESGSNDPMAYFLTVSFTFLVQNPDASIVSLVPKFLIGMGLGTACGYIFGKLMIYITNKIKLDIEGLYPVLILSMVFFTFSFTNFIGGNGFLAIYIAAIILGSSNFIHKKSLMKFYDGQAWLMQIIMFLTLGLLVFPSQIVPFIGKGVLLAVVLIFVARPIAVFIALARANLRWRKKLFISWVGLRGAVPIVFAMYPLIAGIQNAHMIFNLVFFISVSSVLVQGTMLPVVAKWLKVSVPEKLKRKFPLDIEIKDDLKAELLELDIPADSPIAGKAVVELDLPRSALIVLIHRDGKYLTVRGDTVIEGSDHLLIMADTKDVVKDIYACFHLKL